MTKADKEKQSSTENTSISFFQTLVYLFNERHELFLKYSQNEKFIDLINIKLSQISTLKLIEITDSCLPLKRYLIQVIFLKKEDQLYRKERNHPEANWSDKLMSLVGNIDGTTILNGVKNHLGEPVRTKKSRLNKVAEIGEIKTAHSDFIEDNSYHTIEMVIAEIADLLYNLIQLQILEENILVVNIYQKFINQVKEVYAFDNRCIFNLVIAKYHHRMYTSKNGTNDHVGEDVHIFEVMKSANNDLTDPEKNKQIVNKAFKVVDKIFADLKNILILKFIEISKEESAEIHQVFAIAILQQLAQKISYL